MAEDKTTVELSQEDIDKINKDMEDAKSSIVSQTTQDAIEKAKQEARADVEKELKLKQELEEQKKETELLKKQLEDKEKEAAARLDALKKRVDEMSASRAVINPNDPFAEPQAQDTASRVNRMTREQLDEIEKASARAFLGEGYDRVFVENDN